MHQHVNSIFHIWVTHKKLSTHFFYYITCECLFIDYFIQFKRSCLCMMKVLRFNTLLLHLNYLECLCGNWFDDVKQMYIHFLNVEQSEWEEKTISVFFWFRRKRFLNGSKFSPFRLVEFNILIWVLWKIYFFRIFWS